MAAEFAGGAAGLLLNEVLKLMIKAYRCKESLKKLKSTLECVQPFIEKLSVRENDKNEGDDNYKDWLRRLELLLKEAEENIQKYCVMKGKSKGEVVFTYLKRPFVSSKILDINEQIKSKILCSPLITLDVAKETRDLLKIPTEFYPRNLPPNIVAFKTDPLKKLKTMILDKNDMSSEPIILGLAGTGGIGKTLLATMVHNDEDVKAHFGVGSIIWVTVGDQSKLCDLYKTIELGSNTNAYESGDLEHRRHRLIEVLKNKKILLILDDIWERDEHGEPMMHWLDVAKGRGSVTLITTRFHGVLTKAKETICVPFLSEDESWELFCHNAFECGSPPSDEVKAVAEDICKQCGGLPLALVVMGGLMEGKKELSQWSVFLKALKYPNGAFKLVKERVYFPLELSYKELDDELKKCFLYFAAFPEDYEISTEMLCSIWHAENMFEGYEGEKAKDKGFMNLISLSDRSLIQLSGDGKSATIHDVLRNLAICAIQEAKFAWARECYFHSGKDLDTLPLIRKNIKRMSLIGSTIPDNLDNTRVNGLEVLLLSGLHRKDDPKECLVKYVRKLFSTNTTLSYMDISGTTLMELPEDIKNLKRLKYLKLQFCESLIELAEGIKELTHLTSLDLSGCSSLEKLPEGIEKLTRLTSLDLSWCPSLEKLPEGIKKLTSLTSLDLSGCSSLKKLPEGIEKLTRLTSLDLSWCSSLEKLPEGIKKLTRLTSLDLSWCTSLEELPEGIKELTSLTSLDLCGCSSLKKLPEGIEKLTRLTSLNLRWCSSLEKLPKGIKELTRLTSLDLSWCTSLEELPEGIKELTSLTSLNLIGCSSLKKLPEGIEKLKGLISLNLGGCTSLEKLPEDIKELARV